MQLNAWQQERTNVVMNQTVPQLKLVNDKPSRSQENRTLLKLHNMAGPKITRFSYRNGYVSKKGIHRARNHYNN
jgi:hypothetical protein